MFKSHFFRNSFRSSPLLCLLLLFGGISFSGCQSKTLTNQADPTPAPDNLAMGAEEEDSEEREPNSNLEEDFLSIEELLAENESENPVLIADPFEGMNRAIFQFNDGFYEVILEPVSDTYTTLMPDPFEVGISNFFDNLQFPIRFVSYSLQGNLDLAGLETSRFLVDSTVGFAGFLRPSDDIPSLANLPDTDLGLTFAYWGIDHGPYLILPILGPSSLRDGVGFVGERFLDPSYYLDDSAIEITLTTLEILNRSPQILRSYRRGRAAAVDPYVSLRDFYVQFRSRKLETLQNYKKGDVSGEPVE